MSEKPLKNEDIPKFKFIHWRRAMIVTTQDGTRVIINSTDTELSEGKRTAIGFGILIGVLGLILFFGYLNSLPMEYVLENYIYESLLFPFTLLVGLALIKEYRSDTAGIYVKIATVIVAVIIGAYLFIPVHTIVEIGLFGYLVVGGFLSVFLILFNSCEGFPGAKKK